VPNTVTYNGVTISATGTGAATQMWDVPYNTCTSTSTPVSPNSILLGGKWQAISGTPTSFTYTINFSQPVNNINLLMAAANGTIGQSPESFTFTSNGGTISISSTNNCFSTINGNKITANEGGVATIGGAGTFLISAQTPFTQLTVDGPGGLGGTLMSIDCSTVIPQQANTLGCVYYHNSQGTYLYNVATNNSTITNLPADQIQSFDDTHTSTKYWRGNRVNTVREWNPATNPNTLNLNRTISMFTGYAQFYYLQAINNSTLLTLLTNATSDSNGNLIGTLASVDITGNTVTSAQITPLFNILSTSFGNGAMLLTLTNKLLFIGTRFISNNTQIQWFLRQYSYPDGAIEAEITLPYVAPISAGYNSILGLFESGGEIFLSRSPVPMTTTEIYKININSPYPITPVWTNISFGSAGYNSSINCNTVALNGAPPAPSSSPSPTPSLTPPVSPNVGVNTIYKYLDIL
jgi:hypothetical protein